MASGDGTVSLISAGSSGAEANGGIVAEGEPTPFVESVMERPTPMAALRDPKRKARHLGVEIISLDFAISHLGGGAEPVS